ncbi:MFS transporter [Streptomyces inusitatus]|uniref:MFS transporter n=1 Tax=Streptomyces inusitatus TaxID=68221 RepID=A0A918QB96_9ACTN|nr:MFS transporter [Streptomyces inusitatus]GGZ37976.1 MFS transporter [Streptomyces inusitatus]
MGDSGGLSPTRDTAPGPLPGATGAKGRGPSARTGLVLAAVCLSQLIVALDISVVNVALPAISRDLGFSAGSLAWVVNAYTLVFGGLLLLGGRLADLFGHRRTMIAGLLLFGIASLLGGFAQTPGQLIAARAGQGLAGAVLAPIGLTVIMVTFAEGPARSRAVGTWATVAGSGSALGVLAGGLLTDLLGWRWVMLINVPLIAVALPIAMAAVRDRPTSERPRLDILGAVLGTASMTALVYGVLSTDRHPWGSARTLSVLGLAVLLGLAFTLWERRSSAPLVRLGILRTRTVWLSNVNSLLVGAAMVSGFYLASLYLQDVLRHTPLEAGFAFLPFCFGAIGGSVAGMRLVKTVDRRLLIVGGLLLLAAGMAWFSLADASSTLVGGFFGPSLVASVGMGLSMVTNTYMGTSGVAHHEAGLASGLLNAGRQCGGSIGLAVLATVAAAATRASEGAGAGAREALAAGYGRAFLVTAGLALAAAALTAVALPRLRTTAREA